MVALQRIDSKGALSEIKVKRLDIQDQGNKGVVVVDGNFIARYFKSKFPHWSRDQIATILILSIVEFFAATVLSVQAPFYPDVARGKGSTATEYGLVFGIFEIMVFIMSPIYGAKMNYLKPRRVFNGGIFATGLCCIIFGLLDRIEDRTLFFLSCFVVRAVEGMGAAAFDTASFTIIAMEFPNSVSTSFGILEICYGFGLLIGPTLGGALYQIGGYKTPFMVMGGFLFASAVATYFILPQSRKSKEEDGSGEIVAHGGLEMFKMLKIPVIAMTAYSIVATAAGVGFLSANLDYHLAQFHLNKVMVGVVFVMTGGVYAITAPGWGWICDHTDKQRLITLSGSVFTILGFCVVGPLPFIPMETILPLTCFGLALFGLGLAAILVSAFIIFLNDARANGYDDNISTYGLVSGLWTSMCALGYFIGPTGGGVAVDMFGFRWSSLLVIGAQLILIMMLCAYYLSLRRRRPNPFAHNAGQSQEDPKRKEVEDVVLKA